MDKSGQLVEILLHRETRYENAVGRIKSATNMTRSLCAHSKTIEKSTGPLYCSIAISRVPGFVHAPSYWPRCQCSADAELEDVHDPRGDDHDYHELQVVVAHPVQHLASIHREQSVTRLDRWTAGGIVMHNQTSFKYSSRRSAKKNCERKLRSRSSGSGADR